MTSTTPPILTALRGLSLFTNNSAVGGGFNKTNEASKALAHLGELIERGDEGNDDLKAFAEEIQTMADSSENPTREQWASLRQRSVASTEAVESELDATSEPEASDTEIAEVTDGETPKTADMDAQEPSEEGTEDPVGDSEK